MTYLMNNNILVRSIPNYPIGMVRFTQEDVSLSKVRDMISKFEGSEKDASDNPFLVALDGYLLDGHHRYLAKVFDGTCLTVPVIMVSMEIRELIEFAHCYLDGVEDAQS